MMATLNCFCTLAIIALTLSLCLQNALGNITCEHLKEKSCAFAISSAGKRCVLEKHVCRSGKLAYKCATSNIEADRLKNWIESDKCIEECGLDRNTFGISSDSLLESAFVSKLCSPYCYSSCPNIVDLYFNLAAGEGVYLPQLCEMKGKGTRREMTEVKSSGFVAPGPESKGSKPVDLTTIISPALPPMMFTPGPESKSSKPVDFTTIISPALPPM